jgi:arylsulfatase A-like enzyme
MNDRPNLIVFLTDDHARWALPCYGNRDIYAPNLEYLADTGVLMANAFTPTPVCSPARASFWTGLYPSQHGVHDYLAEHEDEIGSRNWLEDRTTLAQMLQETGYETAFCGKWHCGLGEVPKEGFDFWYSAWRQTPKYHQPTAKYSNQGEVETKSGYDTQIITDAALSFLRQDRDRPFFLFVGFATTHGPWVNRAERLVSRYRKAGFQDIPHDPFYPFGLEGDTPKRPADPPEVAAQYYASVSQIDEMVGRVLDELDALGVRDETLIAYTSDHGLNLGHHQVWGKGNATRPLNMLEESIRIPLVLNGPGLPAGTVRHAFINHTDLFMTLLKYAQALPEDRSGYPGQSYKALLEGSEPDDGREVHIGEYGPVRMARDRRYKLILRHPDGPHLLFDLEEDPRENRNLYGRALYQPLIEKLRQQIDAFFSRYQNPDHSGLKPRLAKHNYAEAWDNRAEKGH